MSADLNKVTLMGNVGMDPAIHSMNNGKDLARFSVATSRKWQKDGEWQSETEWHTVVVFDKFAVDRTKQYIQKGSKVYLEGELKTRHYEKDGVTKYTTEVIVPQFAGKLIVLDMQARDKEGPGPSAPPSGGSGDDDFDDDIPF